MTRRAIGGDEKTAAFTDNPAWLQHLFAMFGATVLIAGLLFSYQPAAVLLFATVSER